MQHTTLSTPQGGTVDYPACLVTVAQLEERHPALKGRVRSFILRADLGSPDYAPLRDAIIRLGRSVYIDEPKFLEGLRTHAGKPASTPRNPHGRKRAA
jgi:hypothetical protein